MEKININGSVVSEHMEQVRLFAWIRKKALKYPQMDCIFAIPNGGARHPATAAKMKAEGVKAGIPDIFVPIASGKWHGLFVELKSKAKTARLSAKQIDCIEKIGEQGYLTAVAHGCDEAIKTISDYIGIE